MPVLLIIFMIAQILGGVLIAPPIEESLADTPIDWLDGWDYRTPIEIDGNTEDLTDYQVQVTLQGTNPLVDNYVDFNKVLIDGVDIRFTDDDKTTEIDFWIEEWVDTPGSESATVWVEVPSLLQAGIKTVYVYYGKAGTSSANNGDNTFAFFDNFTGVSHTEWNKYSGNPVLDVVASSWESSKVADPWVIYDTGTYHMWYWGYSGNAQIGYASSTDGISWSKYGSNPIVIKGSAGSYDDQHAHKPTVVYKDEIYYMFYSAQKSGGNRTIALATSTSPTGPWTKYTGNPVLSPTEAWEDNFLDTPSIMYDSDDSIWKMWYSAGTIISSEPEYWSYATSSDGYNWTKYDSNPIQSPPNDGSWLSKSVSGVDVLKIDNVYHMYYNAFDDSGVSRVGYTTSSDGITWNL